MQTDRAALREGRLVRWDRARGFGFVRPADGGRDVFVHATGLPDGLEPEIGTRLVFSAIDDPAGRGQRVLKAVAQGSGQARVPGGEGAGSAPGTRREPSPARRRSQPTDGAERARPRRRAEGGPIGGVSGGPPRGGSGREPRSQSQSGPRAGSQALKSLPFDVGTLLVGALTLFCLLGAASFVPHSPLPLLAYPIFSLVAVRFYARDKLAALRRMWRVPEQTLHLIEALGGWPGAYVAQRTMRHKTVKTEYRAVYWLIVAAHSGLWGLWLFAPQALGPVLRALGLSGGG